MNKVISNLEKNIKDEKLQFAIDELSKPIYKKIVDADKKTIENMFSARKSKYRIDKRKKYPLKPKFESNQKIMIGLTEGANFDITSKDDEIKINLKLMNQNIVFFCKRSNYFNDLSICKIDKEFKLKFNHRVKSRKINKEKK